MKNRSSWCLVGIVSLYRIDGMLVDHVDEALFGKRPARIEDIGRDS